MRVTLFEVRQEHPTLADLDVPAQLVTTLTEILKRDDFRLIKEVFGSGSTSSFAETGDGALFLGEDENRHPDNPVRFLDAGRDALATSPAYRRAREKGGLEPAFAAARALKETRARNRAVRERRAARDAERFEARRRAERRRVRKENARRAAAESTRLRLAAERAAAAATASEAAEAAAARRWRSVKAVGKYVKRRAFFRTGKEKEGETAEET